jgi:triosephosphate isomerase (TIM)
MIILNLKNYTESTGKNLIKIIDSLDKAIDINPKLSDLVYIAPAVYDLHYAYNSAKYVKIAAQHIDNKSIGSTTGWCPAQSIADIGIEYSVLNHSEHRYTDWSELKTVIKLAHAYNLKLIVCCENLDEAAKLLKLKPYAIAYEDKDLIGSGQSITTSRPDEVKKFIELVKPFSKAIIGAGISTEQDIIVGLQFGAQGFILASAFVKAEDKVAKIQELSKPFLVNNI